MYLCACESPQLLVRPEQLRVLLRVQRRVQLQHGLAHHVEHNPAHAITSEQHKQSRDCAAATAGIGSQRQGMAATTAASAIDSPGIIDIAFNTRKLPLATETKKWESSPAQRLFTNPVEILITGVHIRSQYSNSMHSRLLRAWRGCTGCVLTLPNAAARATRPRHLQEQTTRYRDIMTSTSTTQQTWQTRVLMDTQGCRHAIGPKAY